MRVNDVRVVDKPWGREVWWAFEGEYAAKVLEVKKGFRLSLQYHRKKKETMYVLSGSMLLSADGKDYEVAEGESVTILPGVKHRIKALTDLKVLEASTPELDDVVRVEDDYGRK
ncbi:Mannose-6-phosphate isomerase [uncultured archaeon]|nr:Mannose-6-phosphate isomerase [uncultured archaeon]